MNKLLQKIDLNNIRMIDMHAHVQNMESEGAAFSEIAYRKKTGIFTIYCCKNPAEWEFMKNLGCLPLSACAMLSFGIHPWESDKYDPDDHMDLYDEAPIIGEIGLDSIWTDIPYSIQLDSFKKQLNIAKKLRKPVIIHTKGLEAETAALLEGFPYPVLIHWYSGDAGILEKLAKMGCFFTLGPDASLNSPLTSAMLNHISRDRLLAETDGLESIIWAQENHPDLTFTPPDPSFAGNYRNIGANKDFPLIFESLYCTLKCISDYDCVDIQSTVGQNVSSLIEFAFSNATEPGKCLIIAGGDAGPIPDANSFSLIIAADKGLQYALENDMDPDIVIGDFDSYSGDINEVIRNISSIRLPVRKNDSDCQSAVRYALEQGCNDITLCCIMGGRQDHMISNIQTASYAASRGAVCKLIGTDDEICIFSGKKMTFPRRKGWSFSVFAISDKCVGVDISGALYTVSDFTLTNNLTRGLSNEWASDCIEVGVRQGILAVVMSQLNRG